MKTRIAFRDMKKILYAIDGRFGNKVLKPRYRKYWRIFCKVVYIALGVIAFFVMMQLMQIFTNFVNYVVWGITS